MMPSRGGAEANPLLTDPAGGQRLSTGGSEVPVKQQTRCLAITELAALVLLPWLLFTCILLMFAFAYSMWPGVVWTFVCVCIALALLLVIMGTVSRGNFRLGVGFLCLASVSVAITVGLFVHCEIMAEYWRLSDGTVYPEVDPLSRAGSLSDAAVISFVKGTIVDDSRTVGYHKDGEIYCVAPIRGGPATRDQPVEFWAVGANCCEERTAFECGDFRKTGARSAIAICDSCHGDVYRKAVQEAETQYGLTSGADAMLLKWVEDPVAVQDDLSRTGTTVVIIASFVQLCASALAGVMLSRTSQKIWQ